MKAMATTRYGPPLDVLQLSDHAIPAPAANQVLLKLYASSVNPLDSFTIRGPLYFLPSIGKRLKPKSSVAGADLAGVVEAVGKDVKYLHPGDEVFGASFAGKTLGAFAEYTCVSEDRVTLKPTNLSFVQAASVPVAGLTALQALRDHGRIEPGQRVLIDGASGGVGTFAIQIAKALGAEVTAVCSPSKLDIARSLGADHLIDYTREDFSRNGQAYDLILGANAHHSLFAYRRALTPNGTFVMIGGALPIIMQAAALGPLLSRLGRRKFRFFIAKVNIPDLLVLKDLLETGKIVPIIDRCYSLHELAEAVRYREEGHANGKVVIRIATEPQPTTIV